MIYTTNSIKRHKPWSYADFKIVIDQLKEGRQKRLIANDIGRTKKAIDVISYTLSAVTEGRDLKSYNPVFVRMLQAYQSGRAVEAEVTPAQADAFDRVQKAFDELQVAVVEAVNFGAKQQANSLLEAQEKELKRLRGIEEEAKKSNIVGMLRRTFRVSV